MSTIVRKRGRPKGTSFQQPLESKAIQPAEVLLAYVICLHLTAIPQVNRKWYLYLRIEWETGIKPGEGLNIKVNDIFPDRIRIYRFKKSSRLEDFVPIQPALYNELQQYITQYGIRGKLFPETIQGAKYIWDAIKVKANLRKYLTLQSFRYGFGYNFLNQVKGLPINEALAQLQRKLKYENMSFMRKVWGV